MKSPLRKLRGLAGHRRSDSKENKRDAQLRAKLDELTQASQDMQDMRNCYDSLLSAAASTTNCAYEFAESLGELGSCLLEKTALNDDEESGRVLLMLGKVQFELQKLVDIYRTHITQTISTPSESLLNELRTVEDMKRQCDEKREIYEYMLAAQKEKGRSKNSKEIFSSQQLKAAQEDYDEEATLFVFRLKSLKRGQSRSLLTQAARHHSTQLSFFRKGIKSLETVEPHVKLVAEKHHIDYQFSGLEDYITEDDDGNSVDDGYGTNDDRELSFDYGQNELGHDIVSSSRNSMELDQADHTSSMVSTLETAQENSDKSQPDLHVFHRPFPGSQSAPIFAEKKLQPVERIKDIQPPSSRKLHTYVLPTPVDCKGTAVFSSSKPVQSEQQDGISGWSTQLSHSTPLTPNKHVIASRDGLQSSTVQSKYVLKESNINIDSIRTPPPLGKGLSSSPPFKERWDDSSLQFIPRTSDFKKIKRQAFSGPLPNKGSSSKLTHSVPSVQHQQESAMPIRVPTRPRSTSPKVSPSASPPLAPSPKIRELHELPRPPVGSANPTKPFSLIGHSAPLVSRGQILPTAGKIPPITSQTASPLPMPPGVMTRSFSIPSSSPRSSLNVPKLIETPRDPDMTGEVSSPPLTPISLISPARISIIGISDEIKTRGSHASKVYH